jgi:phospholipase/carboxylesterase
VRNDEWLRPLIRRSIRQSAIGISLESAPMTTTRHDDLSLRYVLNVPSGRPDTDEMPMVLVMHGRGADAFDLADLAEMIDVPPGCRFVFPNAPRPFEPMPGMQFGYSWFDGWPPEGTSIVDSRELLLQFIDEVTERYPTPAGKLVLAGFSQGALMTLDVGFRIKNPAAGLIVMSGALFEGDMADLAARKDQPVLIVHGAADDVIPVIAARRTRAVLESHQLAPEYHEFPMAHHVTDESMRVVREFLRKVLRSPES